jgi:2-polyprenyl-3-methyl-5-hydroxy-6-metoxy-1,4-benzoquinol methylase
MPFEDVDGERQKEVRIAHRYFQSFSQDYHRAFEGTGRDPLHRTINRLFRRKTFQKRMEVVQRLLERHGLQGKRVLDLGCGSGEVSLLAARRGARVTGIDVVEEMVTMAREQAAAAGLESRAEFQVGDVMSTVLPEAEVTLIVSVLEYYRDIEPLLARVCAVTRELLIVVDTRGPWWRRALRHLLARVKRFHLYYRDPERIAGAVKAAGFAPQAQVAGHSFWVLTFVRR